MGKPLHKRKAWINAVDALSRTAVAEALPPRPEPFVRLERDLAAVLGQLAKPLDGETRALGFDAEEMIWDPYDQRFEFFLNAFIGGDGHGQLDTGGWREYPTEIRRRFWFDPRQVIADELERLKSEFNVFRSDLYMFERTLHNHKTRPQLGGFLPGRCEDCGGWLGDYGQCLECDR